MTAVDLDGRQSRACTNAEAEALGGKVMAAAGDVARQEAVILDLVGEFDAVDAVRFWDGLNSTAAWLAWACSIATGTAREHVRVARALRRMPKVRAEFAAGRLTFSKVRAMTRLVDRADEDELIGLARSATASQLDRMVAAYRSVDGTARQRRSRQRVSWVTQEDGSIHFTMVLGPEDGAAMIAAIQAGTDANRQPDPEPGDVIPDDSESVEAGRELARAEAVAEIAHHYLASQTDDRSGEDRTMVVLELNASAVDVGTRNVPAGASDRVSDQACRVRNGSAVEPATARKVLCDAPVLGVIIGELGEPLAVGRERRLVTKAQRRALMVRDGHCQFPGCSRVRHLKAHHRISWLDGGPTDLNNLILLCQRHHTRVHEDHITIEECTAPTCSVRWRFVRADGTPIVPRVAGLGRPSPWQSATGLDGRALTGQARDAAIRRNQERMAGFEAEQVTLATHEAELRDAYTHVGHTDHPDAQGVFPIGGGAGFSLAECVDALFRIAPPGDGVTVAA